MKEIRKLEEAEDLDLWKLFRFAVEETHQAEFALK
jgi:hypothetical protein